MTDKTRKIVTFVLIAIVIYLIAVVLYRALRRRSASHSGSTRLTSSSDESISSQTSSQTTTTSSSRVDSQAGFDTLPVTYGSNTSRQNPNYVANIQKILNYYGVHNKNGKRGISVDGLWLDDTEQAIAELRNYRRHNSNGKTIYGLEDCFTAKTTRAMLNGHFFVDENHYQKILDYYNWDLKNSLNEDIVGRNLH